MDGVWIARPRRHPIALSLLGGDPTLSLGRTIISASAKAVSWAWTALIVIALVAPAILVVLGYRLMIVTSGSMVPELGVGSLAIIDDRPATDLGVGDVITFRPIGAEILTTHRIVTRRWVDGRLYFQTKGDANHTVDPNLAPAATTLGRLVAAVPEYGLFLAYAATPLGRLVLLGPPAALMLTREVRALWRHRRGRAGASAGTGRRRLWLSPARPNPWTLLVATLVGTMILVATPAIAATDARFVDATTVSGNTFTTVSQFT